MNNRKWTGEEVEKLKTAYETRPKGQSDIDFARGYDCGRTVAAIRIKVADWSREAAPPEPNILFFDIETLPIIAYTWTIWEANILTENIIKDWCVLSWAANWEGEERIFGDVLTAQEAIDRNDERLIGGMWKLLEKADIVVSQNGRKFDHKKLNARFIHHKMTPPTPYKTIDTLAAARNVAGFTSNKLDWLAQETGIKRRKDDTNMELWRDCDAGNKESLKRMLDYNLGDVEELKQLYRELRPWIPGHPDINMYAPEPEDNCPVCGGHLTIAGRYPTNQRKYNAFRCEDCGCTGRMK